ncbi:Pls/PosA family non-ribosomal peptide synthetase [Actinomadura rugatobispora]|uniref:Pls/PosA family non-ribosomal peptide synthetase n=1 Tax=Actinomadura rugatobispora TaxID=1994 RepID=A0ABW1AB51_9ACTN
MTANGIDCATLGRAIGHISAGHVLACSRSGQGTRWRNGERLEHLFEERCDLLRAEGPHGQPAVDAGDFTLTYGELDARANRLARHLLAGGVGPGDRVGLLFDRAVHSYVGMLAVLKINAVYVPLDPGYPPDRLSFIAGDAGVRTVLSLAHLRDQLRDAGAEVLCLDEAEPRVAERPGHRLTDAEKGVPADDLCYIVYTSGSTGRPKGVAIEHSAICNFVRVAGEVYGIEGSDRVYQGMTIAFDFSVEEIWVPLAAGATLVPRPPGAALVGAELGEFLRDRRISALCCVPTLLATLDRDVPGLRFLLVSGEACPQDLVARWHRPGRRFLNVYGPTEATVTATWTELRPDRPVTIGVPLPTYSVVILDPVEDRALEPGRSGEIGIAGPGLAVGYVNRGDLTRRRFVRDFLGIEPNPSGRIYRTGDLGRFNAEGEIEYHGRIDTQIKIRGYRIELSEIESVLSEVPGIAQAVVGTYEPEPGMIELVAYYTCQNGHGNGHGSGNGHGNGHALANGHAHGNGHVHGNGHAGGHHANGHRERLHRRARERLPGYMVPAYFEELDVIPMLPSDKADRKRLPVPKGPRSMAVSGNGHSAPSTATERLLAAILCEVMHLESVPADAHFFEDLGANSLLMARSLAALRERSGPAALSMADVYKNPTVRKLAAMLDAPGPAAAGAAAEHASGADQGGATAVVRAPRRTSQYVLCGVLQLLLFLGTVFLSAQVALGYQWVTAASGPVEIYQRGVLYGCVFFGFLCVVPVLAKWALIGRWKPCEIRVWSLSYVRFWTVKTLVRTSPLMLFAGSPLYVLYLRMLGARIGRGAVIFSRTPVCTDLISVGAGTVIRERVAMAGYRADDGVITTGRVTLGAGAFAGEQTVLDIGTAMGDRAQLGHASSLHASQVIPAGERWHGCPARPTGSATDYVPIPGARCGTLRRFAYGFTQLFVMLTVTMPLATVILVEGFSYVPVLDRVIGPHPAGLASVAFFRDALVMSLVLFFGGGLAGLVLVVTLPRLVGLLVRPGRVYRLYGIHFWAQNAVRRATNAKFYTLLFGDSSYIVPYLRVLGYRFARPIVQTGTNFGTELRHHSPYRTTVGSGTMVSDGLSIMNADYSSTSFRVAEVRIGARTFFGNNIVLTPQSAIGDNVLLGTKTALPVDGRPREGIGLLGSPPFEIPRFVQRDRAFEHLETGAEFRRRLSGKNRYNLATMGLFLLVRWFGFFVVTTLWTVSEEMFQGNRALAIVTAVLTSLVSAVVYAALVERAVAGFRSLRPRLCSIYDPYFWWHERLWKLSGPTPFNGTPFRNLVWRLQGVRMGRRVFDDGCQMPERTTVTIGDDATLNAGCTIQCHSLEEGVFKLDRIALGAGCTLGVESFIHYGVTVGEGATVDADSFLMKGEEVPPNAVWRGNPAGQIRASAREVAPPPPVTVPVPAGGLRRAFP